ncbi:hypothetical protein [uncultured Arcticibacterium sp.]|uniref:THUMP-like domain-containing protein n=1 Tax=uncultured Arcticibacterium sp. TaxID=2173042 RepID=UPI0030F9A588
MSLNQQIEAHNQAISLGKIDITAYALQNPNKWSSEFLRAVLKQYQFLKKLENKIPTWSDNNGLIGAEMINIEQCSSEETGLHKFDNYAGQYALDLTGGFGVDSYFLSKKFDALVSCEAILSLQNIVKYNFDKLGVSNVDFVNQKAEDYIESCTKKFDLIYLDPDRRGENNKKLVLLEDCSPNLVEILPRLLELSSTIIVKYSPLLDIQLVLKTLSNIKKVEVVAVQNEVKELLLTITAPEEQTPVKIISTNIKKDKTETFIHTIEDENEAFSVFQEPQKYLYEPNAAIMKAGAFKSVAVKYEIAKLAQHSHYYTSETLIEDFPGRTFTIEKVLSYSSKALKPMAKQKFNVLARNFPLNPVTICKKHHLNTGGEAYLIFTQNHKNEKIILSCTRTF